MSYFAHAFSKAFPVAAENGVSAATGADLDNGFITNAGISTADLRATSDDLVNAPFNSAVAPVFGLFGRDSYQSVALASAEVVNGAPLILAGSSILPNDKIGPFHGGYAESNKSKYINPRYVSACYKFSAQMMQQSIWHVGVTNAQPGTTINLTAAGVNCADDGTYTNVPTTGGTGTGFTVDIEVVGGVVVSIVENNVGTGYADGQSLTVDTASFPGLSCDTDPEFDIVTYGTQDCEFTFYCGETYNLFINLSGTPVLRVLNHDAYRKLAAYTGCCPDGAIEPVAVDSTLVFLDWAKQIIESPYLKEFIRPIVFDQAGNPWFATEDEADAAGWSGNTFDAYNSTGYVEGALAGMRLIGAYYDTKFESCTFQTSDYFEKDFIKMDITLSDEEGNPCEFNGLCTFEECCGFNGQGFGDTYLKEIILNESYLQNNFSSDPRIREITQGNALREVVDRYAMYDKYVIEHSVPRTNNPTSVHDNDKYKLCIYVPAGTDMNANADSFETVIATWLTNAGNHLGAELTANGGFIEYGDRTPCPVADLPVAP